MQERRIWRRSTCVPSLQNPPRDRRRSTLHTCRKRGHLESRNHRSHHNKGFDKLFAINFRAFCHVGQLLPILSKGSSVVRVLSSAARAIVGTIPRMQQPRAPWPIVARVRGAEFDNRERACRGPKP